MIHPDAIALVLPSFGVGVALFLIVFSAGAFVRAARRAMNINDIL